MTTSENNGQGHEERLQHVVPVSGLYENWFLDYASYVILDRAVPAINDGFKPVQRRILHAMFEMEDGRYHKVANVIGQTMQYHPHGDASIYEALVNLGQKDLLIDTQGNWGDARTGDSAAAARYIEARLSKFALDVVFNPKTTPWQSSYDGRKREPITLPVKFPMLMAQGVEGIAVGLSTRILPHNFCELIEASIRYLKNQPFELYPDFPTGGMADVSNYNDGMRGGKVRVRAKIETLDTKTVIIRQIPYGTTTQSVIDSIIKANDSGKIKIKKVTDNTAKDVEVEVQLAPGQSPDVTIDALYAFTDCEVSISPSACVIIDEKPRFMGVSELLRISTDKTVNLLQLELEILKKELQEKILFSSLEKIFIENRIYRDIEECETWEAVLETIDRGLEPFKPQFYRTIEQDDIVKLTEIRIKRISRYDAFKADEMLRGLQAELDATEHNLAHIVDFAVQYFKDLLKKYGKGKERQTLLQTFDTITAAKVAANNAKLYVNRAEGFIGFGLKKDEFVCDCSDIDDIIVFRKDGKYTITRIAEKVFVGKDIIHAEVFVKGDERRVYNAIYVDGATGVTRAKRFQVLGITRDKEYDLTMGTKNSKVLYFSSNANGEAELVNVALSPNAKARVKASDFDFAELEIKNRNSQGNIVTKYPVRKVALKKAGVSTLSALQIWYDAAIGRLNKDGNGTLLGHFEEGDRILVLYKSGEYELTSYELTNRYEQTQVMVLERFDPERVVSALYYDMITKTYYLKRFRIETSTTDKKFSFLPDGMNAKVLLLTTQRAPVVSLLTGEKKSTATQEVALHELAEVRGWRTIGQKLPYEKIQEVKLISQEERIEKKRTESVAGQLPLLQEAPADEQTDATDEEDEDKEQLALF